MSVVPRDAIASFVIPFICTKLDELIENVFCRAEALKIEMSACVSTKNVQGTCEALVLIETKSLYDRFIVRTL